MPNVSIDAIAPPRSFAQAGQTDQRDPGRPPRFANFLTAQADNPPPAATADKPPAPPPPVPADAPSHEVAGAQPSAENRQPTGTAESLSGRAKETAGTTSVATDRPKATKTKTTPHTTVPAGQVPSPAASPTPPVQAPANVLPSDASAIAAATAAAAAAADAAEGTADAPPAGDGLEADTDGKAANGKHAAADDAATQIAVTSDPSTQNSQQGAGAIPPVAAVLPVSAGPTVDTETGVDGPDSDPLTVVTDLPGKTARQGLTAPLPRLAAAPVSSDATATQDAADAPHNIASPNSSDPPQPKIDALLPAGSATSLPAGSATPTEATARSAAARPAASPPSGIEQTATAAIADATGSAAPASSTAEPEARPRDVVKPADSAGNIGSTVPTQTAGGPSTAATTSTAAAAPAQSAPAPVPVSEIAVTIAVQAQSGKKRFEIRLDPAELGRIDVQLNVDSLGTVSSRLVVDRPETLSLLVRDASQLQRALQDAGLSTAGGMEFSLAGQGFANRNGFAQQHEFAAPQASSAVGGDTEPVAALQGYAAWSYRSGGLDIVV